MDNSALLKRPKPTDSEEELFHMQEEFLRCKQSPSAKVINLRGSRNYQNQSSSGLQTNAAGIKLESNTGRVKSRFAESKKIKTQDCVSTSRTDGNIVNPALLGKQIQDTNKTREDMVYNTPLAPSNIILGNIVEKKYDASTYEFKISESLKNNVEAGFPKPFVIDQTKRDGEHSLFWSHVSRNVLANSEDVKEPDATNSAMVQSSWATEIHEENLKKLSEMREEEILEEKKKLEMTLTPEIIEFLKKKRNNRQITKDVRDSDKSNTLATASYTNKKTTKVDSHNVKQKDEATANQATAMDIDEDKELVPKPPLEIMQKAKEAGWVHMDKLEPEKLKWMKDLPTDSESKQPPDEPYNARFDFNGLLLPYKDETVPVDKGLHHHGEEPERPGYSLHELLQFTRSATQQQRCTALTTLANIIEKSRKGWYDKALQPAPLIALSEKNILLLLRFSLDDTSVAIVTATLQALRAFLYSEADELCLDRLCGFDKYEAPILIPPKNDVGDTSDLKDHELAQLDAIAALCRTDILLRIRYILSEMRPPPVGVTCALEILIRLTRRSQLTALDIANMPNMLETIIKNFMPLSTNSLATNEKIDNVYGVPVIAALRFCRILTSYGGKSVAEKLSQFGVVRNIISYISSDAGKTGTNLSIESLRLWKILLIHDVGMDGLAGAQLILVSQIQLLLSNHDINRSSELASEYAAALISVAYYQTSLKTNISVLLSKWNTQLPLVNIPTWGITKLLAETLLAVSDTHAIENFSISKSQVFSKLCSTSNLLSKCIPATDREPSSLPNLGVLTQEGQLQPAVAYESCIPFLATTLRIFVESQIVSETISILNHPEFCKYLRKLETETWSLERSWYTRMELNMLVAAVYGASLVSNKLDNKIAQTIWKISLKLISTLPADDSCSIKGMLVNALSKEKLNLELTTNKLASISLDSNSYDLKLNIDYNVVPLYEQYVMLNGDWDQSGMPRDWLYLPLVHMYTKCKNGLKCDDSDKDAILTLLSLELCMPDLVAQLSDTLRFSRLILVYLCDTIYLNSDISTLLKAVISRLVKKHFRKLNFTANLPGLNSFTDLFTAMCEHFCSTSYGDYGFAMALIVPIAQRHDAHYRKLLWSEHAGLLRYLRLPIEELIIPFKEYLYPIEEDTSLIESYLTALVREIIRPEWCPIPYRIALHHSAMYLKQSTKLAIRMRTQIEKLPNKNLSGLLLNYDPATI